MFVYVFYSQALMALVKLVCRKIRKKKSNDDDDDWRVYDPRNNRSRRSSARFVNPAHCFEIEETDSANTQFTSFT